jgi:hypothetical protein
LKSQVQIKERGFLACRKGRREWKDGIWGGCRLSITASHCAKPVVSKHKLTAGSSKLKVTIIDVNLAKNVSHLQGTAFDGLVVFRRTLYRVQFGRFIADHHAGEVSMQVCPRVHLWTLAGHGHRI